MTTTSKATIPSSISASISTTPVAPISGTTTMPTSVQTTSICQKEMAQIGTVYVSSVDYSIQPVTGTDNMDLTKPNGNGINFPSVPNTVGLVDENNKPLYQITLTFNPAGVQSLSSIVVNSDTNVNGFSVEFFDATNPTQPFSITPDQPVVSNSFVIQNLASIVDFPSQLPSVLSAIRISIISTSDNE